MYSFDFDLTDLGFLHVKEIIQEFYSYIEIMKKQAYNLSYFSQFSKYLNISYLFDYQADVGNANMNYLNNLIYISPAHILIGGSLPSDYQPSEFLQSLSKLTPENSLIFLGSKNYTFTQSNTSSAKKNYNIQDFFLNDFSLTSSSARYQFNYTAASLDPKEIESLTNTSFPQLKLPEFSSKYIPSTINTIPSEC